MGIKHGDLNAWNVLVNTECLPGISASGAFGEFLAMVKVSNVSDVIAGTADVFVSVGEAVTNETLLGEIVHEFKGDCLIVQVEGDDVPFEELFPSD